MKKILNAILLENILDVVSFENADSNLDITIKSLSDKPNVYDLDDAYYSVYMNIYVVLLVLLEIII